MLTLHQSNRLEALAEDLAGVISVPLASVFASELIVVQSRGVARWLSLRLARATGVCANVRFAFPAAFSWDLCRSFFGDLPEQSVFDPGILTWRILRLLPQLEALPAFAPVNRYVRGDHLRRFELAARLAKLYDEYLVYRPDWIAQWERGEAKTWQALLWQRLSSETDAVHRAALQSRLVKALHGSSRPSSELPARVSVFSASALAPSQLQLFHALGRASDVHLFVQNPCREYWGDIAEEADIARRQLRGRPDAQYLDVGNSLLASMGKQGRDFIDLLVETAGETLEERDRFVEPGADTVLAAIQSDILHLEERTPALVASAAFGEDTSIQIHSCYSAMREVEVLHDQLLALFSRFPDVEPSDVVVMAPDIENYAPYIEAVFATAEPRIPFNISDRSSEHESTLAATFMALLGLPGSRYDANTVLGVLDEGAVRRRFGLAEGDLDIARTWVTDSQVRWGIDAQHRAGFGVPGTHEHTWRFGLDRLLLGYALPSHKERVFAGILGFDDIQGSTAQVLGRFAGFVEAAIQLETQLAGAKPVGRWCGILHQVIETFFDPPEEQAEELEVIRSAVAALSTQSRVARYGELVPLSVIIAALRAQLEVPGSAFLSGGVTFCAIVPMRSLPFEVVCMIGMNDGAYPRMQRRDAFDLMAQDFRRGDRSRREDDRYLFLDSLSSARRCLYLSYVGRHIREDTVIPPSVLVSELLDYLTREDPGARERLVTQHPLQAFSRRYFEGNPKLFTYSELAARSASVAGSGGREPRPFLPTALPPADVESRLVDLDTFVRFFRNPVKHLFEHRLKIRLEAADEEIATTEPFRPDGLALFDLKQRLLELELRNAPHDGLALARAGGDLPHGPVGDAVYEAESGRVVRVARTLAAFTPASTIDPLRFELSTEELTLSGALTNAGPAGMTDYRMSRTNEHLRMRAWIRHLALNAFGSGAVGRSSRCVTQESVLTFSPVSNARERLRELMELYWQGLHRPVHFFPRTSWAYFEAGLGDIPWKVRAVWEGSRRDESNGRGERDDLYYQAAFRGTDPLDDEFKALARAIFGPMREAMQEEPLP